jgi:uncharacterized protein (TIGR03067 family)
VSVAFGGAEAGCLQALSGFVSMFLVLERTTQQRDDFPQPVLEVSMKALLPILTVSLLVGADAPKDDAKGDKEKIQGTWRVVRFEVNGERPDKEFIEGELKLIFTAEKFWTHVDDPDKQSHKYKLDSTKKPKEIDIGSEGKEETGALLGIYSFDGDLLRICYASKKRPTDFTTKAAKGDRQVLWVLKREKP